MTPQRPKTAQTAWTQCDKCLVSLLSKDSAIHSKDCPPDLSRVSYGFVQGGALYGTINVKSNEDIKGLSSKELDNLVFLSQPVIQICSLSIGCWVIIESEGRRIARVVWPTVEKTLTSVLFTKNGLDISRFKHNECVKVMKILDTPCTARSVTLALLNAPKSLEISSELNNRISKTFEGRIVAVGNKLGMMFYGKLLKYEVKSIQPEINPDSTLETAFNQLEITEYKDFFCIDKGTRWTFVKNELKPHRDPISLLAGVDIEMDELRGYMRIIFQKSPSSSTRIKSILLYGNPGTGKTTIAKALCNEFSVNTITISSPDVYGKTTSEETIKDLFQDAIEHAPSVIIIDEIDILCPTRSSSRLSDSEKRTISALLLMLDSLDEPKVFIIATASKPDNVDPAFRRYGRLDREVEVPTPSPRSRRDILEKFLEEIPNGLSGDELQEVAVNTHGFVGADLRSLCSMAVLNADRRKDAVVQVEDFRLGLKAVRPSAMREVQIEVPNVKWTDIGGQERLKLTLRQCVEWPLTHSESFLRLGITPPKGVLMFGPPGCSKTMIAKALATESGLNFLSIKGPELFSKWVGESERAVREVFRKARQVAPSIIFFDEIDALGGERSSGSSTSVQERVLAQLLTELDGISPLGDVTIVAATNRPDRIDKALLRPGRLDRIVHVPLPDENTRRDIFKIKFDKMPVSNVDVEVLVASTKGYSGAEVNAVCHEAAMAALEEDMEAQKVEVRHFEAALKLVTPRTPSSLLKLYTDYLENV